MGFGAVPVRPEGPDKASRSSGPSHGGCRSRRLASRCLGDPAKSEVPRVRDSAPSGSSGVETRQCHLKAGTALKHTSVS
jgi:hypothetical protein